LQWGHDFRTDYVRLKEFKNISKSLPVLAATATATPLVRADIIRQLNLQDPKQFVLSFNRPNLSFEIIDKKGIKFVPYICSLLKDEFEGQTGIIYRRERKQCEKLAEELTQAGFKVAYYHAELPQDVRRRVQHQWLTGEVLVVIATIAFGMGIDKPDVRFIIHGELTNSIEQYLQECGRAGRDGQPSHCILFFSFGDMMDLEEIICNSPTRNLYYLKVHLSNFAQMVYYAINYTECRRLQLLRYFGEDFNPSECESNPYTACDVCLFKPSIEMKDITPLAKEVVSFMKNFKGSPRGPSKMMVYNLMRIFAGIYKKGEPFPETQPVAGKGKHLGQKDAERFIIKLLAEGFLREDPEMSFFGCHMVTYIGVGPRADELLNDQATFSMPVVIRQNRASRDAKPKFKKEDNEENNQLLNLEIKCYCQLCMLTAEIAEDLNIKFCRLLPLESLRAMAASLPIDEESLLKIDHVTQAFCSKYGQRYLKVIREFADEKAKLVTSMESQGKETSSSKSVSKPARQRKVRNSVASKEAEPVHSPSTSEPSISKRPRARRAVKSSKREWIWIFDRIFNFSDDDWIMDRPDLICLAFMILQDEMICDVSLN
jgi:bloom syndrome protein